MNKILLRILIYPLLIYLGSVGVIVLRQGSYLYYPEEMTGRIVTPEEVGIPFNDITIPLPGEMTIHGWLLDNNQEGPSMLFFHGNAGHLAMRLDILRYLMRLPEPPSRILIIDYPGYGRSTGKPSEKSLYESGNAACKFLLESATPKQMPVIVFGRSLGAAVALEIALNNPVGGLVMEAPFRSVPVMAREVFPFLPGLGLFARQKFDNESKITRVTVPLMIIHGDGDPVVPVSHGRYLNEIAPVSLGYFEIPGAGHDDPYLAGGKVYREAWCQFMASFASGDSLEKTIPIDGEI